MSSQTAETQKKTSLLGDTKFRWLVFSVVVVGVFEFLSLAGWHLPPRIAAPFFAIVILVIGHRTLLGGLRALAKLNFRSINLLLLIATAGAFYLGEYEEAAVVIVLFTLGERLEQFGIQTSRSALQALVDRTPKTAAIKDAAGETKEVGVSEIAVGDILVIKPSDMIAVDAEVVSGSSSVDESTITGEPLPKDKHPGRPVFAGTLNLQGYLEARVTKLASDSTLAKIIETTFQATKAKAETQKFIEKFSAYYTPTIILIALLLVTVPVLFFSAPFDVWLAKALTLLVIACPCALVISTPISIYAAIGNASSRGALVKGGKYIEAIGRVRAVAMDKTRTLTYGRPKVTDVIPFGESTREHLLACAAGIESYSEHPLAQSIVDAARAENITLHAAENFQAVMGKGVKADCVVCYDRHHCVGKLPFITEEHSAQVEVVARVEALQNEGKTSIVISNNDGIEGIIGVTDELKPESKQAVAELASLGVETVMLTGDNRAPAQAVANAVGIREVRAEMLPEDKAEAIRELTRKYGAVAMVGDGVNDAPALALSAVGIAMGAAGSDTAIESASIALLNDRLELVPYLVRLGRRTVSTIKINTSLAIGTKVVFIGLAIGGLSSLALAIFADVGVTVLVILNSLRLLRFEMDHSSERQPTNLQYGVSSGNGSGSRDAIGPN
ncbi:MAG TPA: cation-translocating P-type ATPase [Pyrinomonadaceae bacterium]|nr:cation-translocating P-type ATPase [Pyrinomonadaceae bacterium]